MSPADQIPLIPPAGLFQHIAPLLTKKKATVMLIITAEADKLRVNLTEKAEDTEDEDARPLSLSVIETAQALDAEFPAAITKARERLAAPGSIAEQVDAQVETATASAEVTNKKKKTVAPKPAAAAKKKIVKPHPAPRKAPVKAATVKPAVRESASAPRVKFSKDECLAEYMRLKGVHADKLTMDVYVREAMSEGTKIGRSFERLFGGWKKFAAAGERDQLATITARNAAAQSVSANAGPTTLPEGWPFQPAERGVFLNGEYIYTMPATVPVIVEQLLDIDGRNGHVKVRAIAVTADRIDVVSAAVPVETSPEPAKTAAPPPATPRPVYDTEGKLLGTTLLQPTVNETLELSDSPTMKVIAVGKTRITVEAITENAEA